MRPLEFYAEQPELAFQNWKQDHKAWLSDLQKCEDQHESALEILDRLDDALSEHVVSCKAHERFIRDHDDLIRAHEHGLEELKYWAATDVARYTAKEEQLQEMQERLGNAHSKIRQHHDSLMEEFSRLAQSLTQILTPGGALESNERPESIELK